MRKEAVLIFEDGFQIKGEAFGYPSNSNGEVVFNTGMVGYPETMTDPSYRGQILICTYPLIGNYGIPPEIRDDDGLSVHFESDNIHVRALIVSEYSEQYSHWNGCISLEEWMVKHKIPGITGIDTRMLTRKLREKGTMKGKVIINPSQEIDFENQDEKNFASEVSPKEVITYKRGEKKVILVDCGAKNNIIRAFLNRNMTVIRVPYDYDFTTIEADGILISNGPGDPKMCVKTIEHTTRALKSNIPILGICLGSQILGLAAGADTYKLKYGHRGHNQPCNETGSKRCYITSQNHGYAVNTETLPEDWREWFVNDNDGTNEGILHISKPFFGAQFHPEASPGPDDTEFIFSMFVRAI